MPSPTRRNKRNRPVTSKGEERRRQILDNAADLFTRLGYDNVSVEDIAEASDIGKSTLYHYFRSREDIVFAMHDLIADEMLSQADEIRAEDIPVREAMYSAVLAMLSMIRDRPGYVRVFFEHYGELSRPLQRKVEGKRDAYAALIEGLLQQGIDRGELRPVDARLAMLALFGMTNWAYQWYRPAGSHTPEELAQIFVETLFDGIGVR